MIAKAWMGNRAVQRRVTSSPVPGPPRPSAQKVSGRPSVSARGGESCVASPCPAWLDAPVGERLRSSGGPLGPGDSRVAVTLSPSLGTRARTTGRMRPDAGS